MKVALVEQDRLPTSLRLHWDNSKDVLAKKTVGNVYPRNAWPSSTDSTILKY
jgi:hypothetical protein